MYKYSTYHFPNTVVFWLLNTLYELYRVTMLTRGGGNGPEALGLLLRLKGSFGLWMDPGLRRGPGLGSMGNMQTEGSVSL
jgi:hypothetical protein